MLPTFRAFQYESCECLCRQIMLQSPAFRWPMRQLRDKKCSQSIQWDNRGRSLTPYLLFQNLLCFLSPQTFLTTSNICRLYFTFLKLTLQSHSNGFKTEWTRTEIRIFSSSAIVQQGWRTVVIPTMACSLVPVNFLRDFATLQTLIFLIYRKGAFPLKISLCMMKSMIQDHLGIEFVVLVSQKGALRTLYRV